MLELEIMIGEWRTRLSAALPEQEEAVRELEEHLRDAIAALQGKGATPEEAFALAVERMGEPAAIAREFARVGVPWLPSSRAALVILALVAGAVMTAGGVLVSGYAAGKWNLLFATHVFTITAGYLSVFGTGLIGCCALMAAWRPLTRRERRELRHLIFRMTIASAVLVPVGIGLGMVWSVQSLGRAWSNAQVELGAVFILASIVVSLVVQSRVLGDPRVRWLLAMTGNIALILGWIWVRAATPAVPILWLSLAFIASQVAIMLLPERRAEVQMA